MQHSADEHLRRQARLRRAAVVAGVLLPVAYIVLAGFSVPLPPTGLMLVISSGIVGGIWGLSVRAGQDAIAARVEEEDQDTNEGWA